MVLNQVPAFTITILQTGYGSIGADERTDDDEAGDGRVSCRPVVDTVSPERRELGFQLPVVGHDPAGLVANVDDGHGARPQRQSDNVEERDGAGRTDQRHIRALFGDHARLVPCDRRHVTALVR